MTAISVSERLLEMAAFYTPLALTVTYNANGGHKKSPRTEVRGKLFNSDEF